jgi:hypothetical protein
MPDESIVERMAAQAPANGYRFGNLVEAIVTSPQFLNRRIAERQQLTEQRTPPTKAKL